MCESKKKKRTAQVHIEKCKERKANRFEKCPVVHKISESNEKRVPLFCFFFAFVSKLYL